MHSSLKKIIPLLFALLILPLLSYETAHLSKEVKEAILPHLLPKTHPIKPILDILFSIRVTQDANTFFGSGFELIFDSGGSFVKVVRHPALPGYVLKIYLDDDLREKHGQPGWYWLSQRCEGVKNAKDIIKRKKLKHFCVPDKYLYLLPPHLPHSPPVILIATDMQIAGRDETLAAWLNASKAQIKELYTLLKHGSGSNYLTGNIPYSHFGKFALIDTEYPKRKIKMEKVKRYLSPEMQIYWDQLTKD